MKIKGKIIKGVGGFYYVVAAHTLYECRARGLFRKEGITPLIGDIVDIEPTGEEGKAYLLDIHERTTELIRPAVANADQALLVFSVKNPNVSLGLIDRFLANMQQQDMPVSICITKIDLLSEEELNDISSVYENAGYEVFMISNKTGEGIDKVREFLSGKSTVLSGPSGVGKSSLIKNLIPDSEVEIGDISKKIGRGKNTTRHTEIMSLDDESFVYDTPGYSSIELLCQDETELGSLMREFIPYLGGCKFSLCSHISEPECVIRDKVSDGTISETRYNSYKEMYGSIKTRRKW
ncbi:MAG: ribosome small subunit-dependent GTPase A [Eubacterium sp.]|nr:ribosome small subunit-dependent GTPase A [Eubacterium sp.]